MDIMCEYAYHYYESAFPKFANIRDVPPEEAVVLDHKFIREQKDKERYYKARTAVEELMIHKFLAKGGKPALSYPHYFVINKYDFLSSGYNKAGCVKIPISYFDKGTISFTYGDSFDVFYTSKHPTKRKIYTVDEIGDIIEKYKGTKTNYNLYIEMQLWDDPYKYTDFMVDEEIQYYQYQLKDVLDEKQIQEYAKYKSLIDSGHYVVPTDIHGVGHVKRVLIHSIILAKLNELNDEEKTIFYLSAVYHDIGRNEDGVDLSHGLRSCQKIDRLGLLNNYSEYQRNMIKYIIENHCYDEDKEIPQEIDCIEAKRLSDLFKDADALDRVRINDLDTNYLRNEYSKRLINIAWILCKTTSSVYKDNLFKNHGVNLII